MKVFRPMAPEKTVAAPEASAHIRNGTVRVWPGALLRCSELRDEKRREGAIEFVRPANIVRGG